MCLGFLLLALGHDHSAPHQPPNKLLVTSPTVLHNGLPQAASVLQALWVSIEQRFAESQCIKSACLFIVSQIKVSQTYFWDLGKSELLLWFLLWLQPLLHARVSSGRECWHPILRTLQCLCSNLWAGIQSLRGDDLLSIPPSPVMNTIKSQTAQMKIDSHLLSSTTQFG